MKLRQKMQVCNVDKISLVLMLNILMYYKVEITSFSSKMVNEKMYTDVHDLP